MTSSNKHLDNATALRTAALLQKLVESIHNGILTGPDTIGTLIFAMKYLPHTGYPLRHIAINLDISEEFLIDWGNEKCLPEVGSPEISQVLEFVRKQIQKPIAA